MERRMRKTNISGIYHIHAVNSENTIFTPIFVIISLVVNLIIQGIAIPRLVIRLYKLMRRSLAPCSINLMWGIYFGY